MSTIELGIGQNVQRAPVGVVRPARHPGAELGKATRRHPPRLRRRPRGSLLPPHLRFAGGAAEAQPVSKSNFAAMEERAQHYLRLAQTDPSNAQAWSFCGMAAMAQAHGQNEAQVRQAAMALKSIATTTLSPCGEVITDSLEKPALTRHGRPPSTLEDALRR